MEEAEALGTKMAIQVSGEFKCFGTAQHIKAKFGKGFSMLVKFNLERVLMENEDLLIRASEMGNNGFNINASLRGDSIKSKKFRDEEKQPIINKDSFIGPVEDDRKRVITLNEAKALFKAWLAPAGEVEEENRPLAAIDLDDELTEYGLLSIYFRKMQAGEPIVLEHLMLRVMLVNEICAIVKLLTDEFGYVELVD